MSVRYPGAVSNRLTGLPRPTVARLPLYLRQLNAFRTAGMEYVSSHQLASSVAVSRDVLRKDLSGLGQLGRRGKGYPVAIVEQAISQVLGLTEEQPVVLIGAGQLGTALVHYQGFAARGMYLYQVFDADPRRIGQRVGDHVIADSANLKADIEAAEARLAIITVPAEVAQFVTDDLVAAGIRGILNFAPVDLKVPPTVSVRVVDVSAELQILAFHQSSLND